MKRVLPGVIVTLTGRDVRGQKVEIVTMTDGNGGYRFAQLPGGTYDIVEEQPKAFYDAGEVRGTVAGVASGAVGDDRFVGVVLAAGASGTGFNFGEWGLKAKYVSRRMQLASTPPADQMLREQMARAEEQEGDVNKAQAIRQGQMVELRRIGSDVTFVGTSVDDAFRFLPAIPGNSADRAEHRVEANGLVWKFAPAEVTGFRFDAGSGSDKVELFDSAGNDALNAANQTANLQGTNYRAEAIAFELVHAVSKAGGNDTVQQAAIDFVLELEGNWKCADRKTRRRPAVGRFGGVGDPAERE